MDEKPIISVIIPAYNVEGYLRRCLNSLKRQTFTQIEVICIDDGSTDGTGAIADEFTTSEWPRFRCIHTQNQGVSAARNLGIDVAEGDWLMFVDSDDTVHKDYCRLPYKAACHYGADLVIFDHAYEHKRKLEPNKNLPVGVIDFETAIKFTGNAVWRRLYKKELFKSIRFPEGKIYEDILTTYKVMHEAKKIALLNFRLYYYTVRKNSISHEHSEERAKAFFGTTLEKWEAVRSYGCSEDAMIYALQTSAIQLLSHTRPADDRLHHEAEKIVNSIQGYPKYLSKYQKGAVMLWRINRKLFNLMALIFRRGFCFGNH